MLPCAPSGGGHPGGGQHHRVGDLPAPADGLPLHPVLRVQALQPEEEEEEGRRLLVIAAPISPPPSLH